MFKCFREVSAAITGFFNKFVKKDFSATHSNLISLIKFLLILCFFKFLNFTCNCDSFDTAFVIVLFIKLLWFAQISFRLLRADLSKISEKELENRVHSVLSISYFDNFMLSSI